MRIHGVAKIRHDLATKPPPHITKLTIFIIFKCAVQQLSTFTFSCNHHHHPSPELFSFPELKPCPH